MRAIPGGPLLLHGDLVMRSAQGVAQREVRVAMCRCGRSANQPYCDNSHRTDVSVASPPPPPQPQNPAEICAPQPDAAGA